MKHEPEQLPYAATRLRFSGPPVGALAALSVMALWGCLIIYTARALGESPAYFVSRQLVWLSFGAAAFLAAAAIPFSIWKASAPILWLLAGAGMTAVLLWGERINGMQGWFVLPGRVYVQPSEFAKGALVLLLCAMRRTDSERARFWKMLCCTAVFCVLVLMEPDLGSCLILFAAFLIVYFLTGGAYWRLLCAGALFAGAALVFALLNPYAWKRLSDYVSGDSTAWHLRQFQYALAHGGLTGSPGGNALWSNAYLPLPHTDSLYATIVESSGLIGGLIVLTLFVVLGMMFVRMARKRMLTAEAGAYIASIGFLYLAQALLHISVNVVLLPTTGVTLPILSYGGSSLLSTMIALGVCFSAVRSDRA